MNSLLLFFFFSTVPAAEAQEPLDLKHTCLFLWAHQQLHKLTVEFHQVLAQPYLFEHTDTTCKMNMSSLAIMASVKQSIYLAIKEHQRYMKFSPIYAHPHFVCRKI